MFILCEAQIAPLVPVTFVIFILCGMSLCLRVVGCNPTLTWNHALLHKYKLCPGMLAAARPGTVSTLVRH